MVLPQQTEPWGILKEVEAGSVVWADALGLLGCIRVGSRSLCDVGLRNDLDRGGNWGSKVYTSLLLVCWDLNVSWAACRRNQLTSEAPARPVTCFVQEWKLKCVKTQNALNAPVLGRGVLCYGGAVGVGGCPGWSEAAGCCLLNAKGWGDRERARASSSAAAGCDQGRFNAWCIQHGRGWSLCLASAQQEDVTRRQHVRS